MPSSDENDFSASEDEDCGADGSESNDVYSGNEKIEVDFEGRNPVDCDFDGIKQLLRQLFLNAKINTNELSELIIGQNYVGSVLTQCLDSGVEKKSGKPEEEEENAEEEEDEDDEDDENTIFGLTTVLNLTNHKSVECVKQIKSYLIEKSKSSEEETSSKLKEILSDDSMPVGFIINERFINIPPQIAIPMLENLQKEMKRADDKKMPFKFSHFLMILKYYKTDEKGATSSKKKKKNQEPQILFSNPEEEIFDKNLILDFEFSVAEDADSGLTGNWLENDEALTPYRKVVVFEAKELPNLISNIKEIIE